MLPELRQQGIYPEAEDAGVPQESAAFKVLTGGFQVRLLHEAGHLAPAPVVERLPCLDVAETGLGTARRDATGDQIPFLGQLSGMVHGLDEGGFILDQVVGGHDHQHAVLSMGLGKGKRGMGDGRSRIAALRLQQIVRLMTLAQAGFGQLVLTGEIMFAVGDGHYGAAAR